MKIAPFAQLSSQKVSLLTSPARRPSALAMAERLRASGVEIKNGDVTKIEKSVKRLNALHQLDFEGGKTAFEHIASIAAAGKLADGSPSALLASELFTLAGSAREAEFGKCYARTSHTIYSVHHAGEMARILAALGVQGKVIMADGQKVKWDPKEFSLKTKHADSLWGALNHLLLKKKLPATAVLDEQTPYANRAEMSNLSARLMGGKFVNVDGQKALKHLNDIVDSVGPMLAEYDNHGGSVAGVSKRNKVMGLDEGQTRAKVMAPYYDLGYVVVPAKDAAEMGLEPIKYPRGDASGYMKVKKPK